MPKALLQSALREHKQNNILAGLPKESYQRLAPHLELIPLEFGSVLYETGARLRYIYFPTDSIITLLCGMENGASVEIGVVGNEGLVGVNLFLGGQTTSNRAVVQSAGHAYRLGADALRREFEFNGPLQHVLLRYTQAFITMTTQAAVCNRHHSVDQQLCRWLLLNLDRSSSNELLMTQELIANMLGVRREGVTEAAGRLQAAGIINYSRGHISVINRPKLEAQTCECYAVVKKEFNRLLPPHRKIDGVRVDRAPGTGRTPYPYLAAWQVESTSRNC